MFYITEYLNKWVGQKYCLHKLCDRSVIAAGLDLSELNLVFIDSQCIAETQRMQLYKQSITYTEQQKAAMSTAEISRSVNVLDMITNSVNVQ